MADRQHEFFARQGHGTKRKATATNNPTPTTLTPALTPTQSSPPRVLSPYDSFQVPALPNSQKLPVPLAPKVAIPRLRRPEDIPSSPAGSIKAGDKHRVNHACEPCRHRKTKCSGERPRCKHCEDFKIACVYADGKRDRVKKEFHYMTAKVESYEQLLLEVMPSQDAATQARIKRVIEKEVVSEDDENQSVASSRLSQGRPIIGDEEDGEDQAAADVGSTGSLDRIREDYNRDPSVRATGFMGKTSEITWVHRIREQLENSSPNGVDEDRPMLDGNAGSTSRISQTLLADDGISDSTYNCDDLTMFASDQVEPFELPPRPIAESLLQIYLDAVHPTFPIIGKLNFSSQVQSFFDNENSRPGKNWLAVLNLVFAIAAKYCHLVQHESRGDERDHLIYFTRARLLGMDGDSMLAQPDLQRVQVSGLMTFYLASINQINRAWMMCGTALRYSVALGLHLRDDNPKLSDTNKEIRYRVWWALYGLERSLGVMTGRPTSVVDLDCMTPMPVPIDEESFSNPSFGMHNEDLVRKMRRISSQGSPHTISSASPGPSPRTKGSPPTPNSPTSAHSGSDFFKSIPPNLSLYFALHTQLNGITHDVLIQLYRPTTKSKTWSQIQTAITGLDKSLDSWRSSLPPILDFAKKQRDQQFIRQRMCLGFFYFSTKIIVFRPCLCRIDRRIPHQSNKSKDFNRVSATSCVQAAKGMLDLIPDEPNPVGLYKVSPWWCLTHLMMQSATVLILELFFRAEHMPHESKDILKYAKKAVYWLNQMARENIAAQRAWRQCDELLRRVAPRIGRDADEMPTETPQAHGHKYGQTPSVDGWGANHPVIPQYLGHTPYGVALAAEGEHSYYPGLHTTFDEYLPFDTTMTTMPASTVSHVSSLFPTSTQMLHFASGSGHRADESDPSQYYSQPHEWDGMGGAS